MTGGILFRMLKARNIRGGDDARGESLNPKLLLAISLAFIGTVLSEQALVRAAAIPNEKVRPAQEVPKRILTGAQNLLVSRVGREFFRKYLALDQRGCAYLFIEDSVAGSPERSRRGDASLAPLRNRRPAEGLTENSRPPKVSRWMLRYNLLVLRKPWVRGTVTVFRDSVGVALGPLPVDGVSDCIRHPEECTFSITEANARRIAKSAGLSEGITPWKVSFQWDRFASVPCYVWMVSNTLTTDSTGFSGHFETMLISASTGRVLTTERH